MIQEQTILQVIDNSGARTAKCIKVLNRKPYAKIGDLIVVSIIKVKSYGLRSSKIKKGGVFLALVTGVAFCIRQQGGGTIHTSVNSVCLLNRQKKLLASRINKPIARELKKKKLLKAASLSFAGFF